MPLPASAAAERPACPHCDSHAVQGHGSFRLKNGVRQQRYRCRGCERTFSFFTGTALHYKKKRDLWSRFLDGVIDGWSVRRTAAILGIHPITAFRWRHLTLSGLAGQPQPVLAGCVAALETFIPYSEKGSRKTDGPGAYGSRAGQRGRAPGRRFRRLSAGKPSCVLLASCGDQPAATAVSQGRPSPEQLCHVLQQVLGEGAELLAEGQAPYAEACLRLGVPCPDRFGEVATGQTTALRRKAWWLRQTLHTWLRRFRGVATKYLDRYLAWYRLVRIPAATSRMDALITLLVQSLTLLSSPLAS